MPCRPGACILQPKSLVPNIWGVTVPPFVLSNYETLPLDNVVSTVYMYICLCVCVCVHVFISFIGNTCVHCNKTPLMNDLATGTVTCHCTAAINQRIGFHLTYMYMYMHILCNTLYSCKY